MHDLLVANKNAEKELLQHRKEPHYVIRFHKFLKSGLRNIFQVQRMAAQAAVF